MPTAVINAEIDLAWRGYCGRAMLPSFFVCSVVSLILLTGSWYSEEFQGFGARFGSLIFFQITIALWLVQACRWLYRGTTYVYRLTNRHLYLDRGFLYSRETPIALENITKVEWGCDAVGLFSGVGWVQVTGSDRGPTRLRGVWRPAAFAELIEATMTKAKATLKKDSRG